MRACSRQVPASSLDRGDRRGVDGKLCLVEAADDRDLCGRRDAEYRRANKQLLRRFDVIEPVQRLWTSTLPLEGVDGDDSVRPLRRPKVRAEVDQDRSSGRVKEHVAAQVAMDDLRRGRHWTPQFEQPIEQRTVRNGSDRRAALPGDGVASTPPVIGTIHPRWPWHAGQTPMEYAASVDDVGPSVGNPSCVDVLLARPAIDDPLSAACRNWSRHDDRWGRPEPREHLRSPFGLFRTVDALQHSCAGSPAAAFATGKELEHGFASERVTDSRRWLIHVWTSASCRTHFTHVDSTIRD